MAEYVVYGHNQCKWCTKAKQDLGDAGYSYEYRDIREKVEWMDEFSKFNHPTVPLIVWEGAKIGGYDDLELHLNLREFAEEDFKWEQEII